MSLEYAPVKLPQKYLVWLLCLIPASYLFVCAGYAVIHFREFGTTVPYFLRYIVSPLCLAGIILWVLIRKSYGTSMVVGLNSCAVLIALFAFETFAEMTIQKQVHGLINKSNDISLETKSFPMGATLQSMNLVLGVDRLSDAMLGGVPYRPALKCISPIEGPLRYVADRYGFNNPDDVYDQRSNDVLLLGDSFVEGICLSPGKQVADQVRDRGLRTVALGMRGNGPLTELATLGRFGPHLRPRHTLLVIYAGNDWSNLETELATPWLRTALSGEPDFGVPAIQPERMGRIDEALDTLRQKSGNASSRSFKLRMLRNFLALSQTWSALGLHYPKLPQPQPEFDAVIGKMRNMVNGWNGDFTIVYVPPKEAFQGMLPNRFAFDAQHKIVLDAARAQGVPVIDLARHFKIQSDPASFYGPKGHFSAKGAEFVSHLIAERMKMAGHAASRGNRGKGGANMLPVEAF